jgi:hypothetical protein
MATLRKATYKLVINLIFLFMNRIELKESIGLAKKQKAKIGHLSKLIYTYP